MLGLAAKAGRHRKCHIHRRQLDPAGTLCKQRIAVTQHLPGLTIDLFAELHGRDSVLEHQRTRDIRQVDALTAEAEPVAHQLDFQNDLLADPGITLQFQRGAYLCIDRLRRERAQLQQHP